VHATLESGTEMLIAGRPLTLGDFVTVEVAHDANTTPATEHTTAVRTSERTWAEYSIHCFLVIVTTVVAVLMLLIRSTVLMVLNEGAV